MCEGVEPLQGRGGGLIPGGGGPERAEHKSHWSDKYHDVIRLGVSRVKSYLSCPAEEASCLGGAYPLERRDPDQVACPLEDPSVVACQGAVPSYLQRGGRD